MVVIDHLKNALGIEDNQISQCRAKKAKKKGEFKEKTYINIVGVNEDDPLLEYYLGNPDIFPEVDKPE